MKMMIEDGKKRDMLLWCKGQGKYLFNYLTTTKLVTERIAKQLLEVVSYRMISTIAIKEEGETIYNYDFIRSSFGTSGSPQGNHEIYRYIQNAGY